jgi:hypothetical protein
MPKRPRNSIIFIEDQDDYVVLTDDKTYKIPISFTSNYVNDLRLNPSILHNEDNKALLNFDIVNTETSVVRFEINPIQYFGSVEWVVDN